MWFSKERLYLDHASATPVCDEARKAVGRGMRLYANPGGLHTDAVEAKRLLEDSRARIARELECKPREITFTAGLTEANNIAIVGAARSLERARRTLSGTHWIVSSIEHSSVLECFAEVERLGGAITHIEPDERGIISPERVATALRPDTVFVSVGWANNEIGVVQPLARISEVIRGHEKASGTRVIFHSDAGQGPLYRFPHVHTLGVDLFSLGSGKLYGPRGIGALYAAPHVTLSQVVFGGGQERGLRSGTEEPALASGFAAALVLVAAEREAEAKRLGSIRDDMASELEARIPGVVVNGDPHHSLPHMLNISVPGQKTGEYLALQLDRAGIAVSTKSACDEGQQASHVVAALDGEPWRAINTLRISLGRSTTRRDVRRVVEGIVRITALS